jgi:hypothetical protein
MNAIGGDHRDAEREIAVAHDMQVHHRPLGGQQPADGAGNAQEGQQEHDADERRAEPVVVLAAVHHATCRQPRPSVISDMPI